MSVIHINHENFEKEVMRQTKPVLIDFYADWCGPCRMAAPIVEEIADEHPEYAVAKINVDDEPELAQKFKIVSIPALFVLKKGKITAKEIGLCTKEEILKMFE